MSRIIYGFSGEGSGHATRTREMVHDLQTSGHEVRLASYDRGYQSLKNDFNVVEIEGLTIASSDNRVSVLQTIRENLMRLPAGTSSLLKMRSVFNEFQPHAVVSDFEPLTAYLAEHFDVPLITLDNQHRMRYVKYVPPPGSESQARFTRRLIQAMVPWPSVSLITAFMPGQTTNDRTFVFPPIVSSHIRQAKPSVSAHSLVYLTSGFDSLLTILKSFHGESFFIYGYDRDDVDENLTFFRKSQQGFVDHLASAKSVIATAGFTLISEALFLGKPFLALPMAGQFEQELNAWQLQSMGYGLSSLNPSADAVGHFLYRLPEYRMQLAEYLSDDGTALKEKLGELVMENAALAKEFRRNRN